MGSSGIISARSTPKFRQAPITARIVSRPLIQKVGGKNEREYHVGRLLMSVFISALHDNFVEISVHIDFGDRPSTVGEVLLKP